MSSRSFLGDMDATDPVIMLKVENFRKLSIWSIIDSSTEKYTGPGISIFSSSSMAMPDSYWPRLEAANSSDEGRTDCFFCCDNEKKKALVS